ncbi:hypothetical protein [Roseicella aquatilis]|uniref:Uncharacterized protein n=1 Tax=Roseicella aquatilis TaxID=2527868 RepID=A0A4R4DKC7_9PROT|nr:hypothetical protein [Roseicella aquatilis]TCZ61250.1 hypothetical protein EXY23_11915 [Roseicella aquatilis]
MQPMVSGVLLTLAWVGAALAQPASPPSIPLDNREPRPGVVQERERAAGVAPSAPENRAEARTVDQLYRELTGRDPNAPASSPNPPLPQGAQGQAGIPAR